MQTTLTSLPIRRHIYQIDWFKKRPSLSYSRDFLLSQDPEEDADRIWEAIEARAKAKQSATLEQKRQSALDFYATKLRPSLEATNLGQYVAIHADTHDYLVERRSGKALREMQTKHPNGQIIVHLIGLADAAYQARLHGGWSR